MQNAVIEGQVAGRQRYLYAILNLTTKAITQWGQNVRTDVFFFFLFFLISKELCSFKIKCNLAVAKVTGVFFFSL